MELFLITTEVIPIFINLLPNLPFESLFKSHITLADGAKILTENKTLKAKILLGPMSDKA